MNHKILIVAVFTAILLQACTTTKDLAPPSQFTQQTIVDEVAEIINPQRYIILKYPVYILAPSPETLYEVDLVDSGNPEDIVARRVEESNIGPADLDYVQWQGAIMEYDYDPGIVYHVYASPIRITDIELQPGETIIGDFIIGESRYWSITNGTSAGNINHVYIRPERPGIETTLIINTTRRRYYLIIRSYENQYMVGVRWNHPLDELRNMVVAPIIEEATLSEIDPGALAPPDYSNYSFDYSITMPGGQVVPWEPESVFDDGLKTYIVLLNDALKHELPALHLSDGQIVNYRIEESTLIIDKLIETAELRIEDKWIQINKKINTEE